MQQTNRAIVGLNPLDLTTANEVDYYIGYNRAAGINAQTVKDGNTISIVKKIGNPLSGGQSWKVAALQLGDSYIINDYNGENGKDIEIQYIGLTNDPNNLGRDATILIIDLSIADDGQDDDQSSSSDNSSNGSSQTREGVPCKLYDVVLKTDDYPGDNEWTIVQQGGIGEFIGRNMEYTEQNEEYVDRDIVCLPYNQKFNFKITDLYGDGICCGQGQGGYKIKALSDNTVVIAGGALVSAGNGDSFKEKEEEIETGDNPNPTTGGSNQNNQNSNDVDVDSSPQEQEECRDLPETLTTLFKFKKKKNKRISCYKILQKGKCKDKKKFKSKYNGPDNDYNKMKFHDICARTCGTCF